MWWVMVAIAGAGALGGLVAGIVPRGLDRNERRRLAALGAPRQPGVMARLLVGGISALVAWGLTEPAAGLVVVGARAGGAAEASATVGELIAAFGVGLTGFKWLSSHAAARLNDVIAAEALRRPIDVSAGRHYAAGKPGSALLRLRQSQP